MRVGVQTVTEWLCDIDLPRAAVSLSAPSVNQDVAQVG
jgi:hypothetical protein